MAGSNCDKWATGSMDLTSSSTTWIWAFKNGSPINADSTSTTLSQHDNMNSFTFNLVTARGGNSLNPFITADHAPTQPVANSGSSDQGIDRKKFNAARVAHASIMSLAFVLFFPVGAIVIRLFSFTGLVWVHAATQIFAYAMAIVGLGLGVYIALKPERQVRLLPLSTRSICSPSQ